MCFLIFPVLGGRVLLCYCIFLSLYKFAFCFYFRPISALYANLPAFYSGFFLYRLTSCVVARAVRKWGGGVGGVGSHGWHISARGFVQEIILARDLMCQPEAQWQVPVQILVLQVTGESISADHSWVRSNNHNFNSAVYPAPHVRNGFIHICH